MRAKEVKRLRSANLELRVAVLGPDGIRANQEVIIGEQAARIKELEAIREEAFVSIEQKDREIKRLEAALLEARHDWACSKFDDIRTRDECDQHAREALEGIKEGGKDE
jgi:hypothetical protein